jgi:hypothetical protein
MLLPGQSRQLPYFTDYVRRLVSARPWPSMKFSPNAAIAVVFMFLLLMLDSELIAFMRLPILILSSIGMALFVVWMLRSQRKTVVPGSTSLHDAAVEFAHTMMPSISKHRLHRDLNPAAAQLLEESARNWNRIESSLNTPFWSSEVLPAHWKTIRAQSKNAADSAMEELMVLLRDGYMPNASKPGWEEVIEDVVETYVTGPRRRGGQMPVAFDQAREIAEKLKLLASEVEQSSRQLVTDGQMPTDFSSANALDLALNDFRTVREAEHELTEDVQQRLRG